MDERTRNILIGILVLVVVASAGSLYLPRMMRPGGKGGGTAPGGPGEAEYAAARALLEGGRLPEAHRAYLQVIQQHAKDPVAARARADMDYGIAFYEAQRLTQTGQAAQAQVTLGRIARDGARTEWGPRAGQELARLGQPGAVAGAPAAWAPGAQPAGAADPSAGRQARLVQANALLEAGRSEEARAAFQALANERVEDQVATAARLSLETMRAAADMVRSNPEVARARLALHRLRASLLAYRGANGRLPDTLDEPGLEQFGFSYRDLQGDVARIDSYRPEPGGQFEVLAVARDPNGTRVRATDRAVEDVP